MYVCSSAYIEVNSYFANRTIVDVVGTIYGSQEPGEPPLRTSTNCSEHSIIVLYFEMWSRSPGVARQPQRCLGIWRC